MKQTISGIIFVQILFIFSLTNAFGQNWNQLGSDINGIRSNDRNGKSVDINSSGNTIVISSYYDPDDLNHWPGRVRVLEWNGTDWQQKGQELLGFYIAEHFGHSVAIDSAGTHIVVGARDADALGNSTGELRIYEWNGSQWIQKGNRIIGENAGDRFGFSVDISADGETVIAGAPYNTDGGTNAGHARAFNWNGSAWVQLGADLDGVGYEGTGYDVSINGAGNIIAVGHPDLGNGRTRIFEWDGTNWLQLGSDLTGIDFGDKFGKSLCLDKSGQSIVIGAPWNDINGSVSGQTYVYEYDGTNWNAKGNPIIGLDAGDRSGQNVTMSGDGERIVISDPYNDIPGLDAGQARTFEWNGSDWVLTGNILQGIDADNPFEGEIQLSHYGTHLVCGWMDMDTNNVTNVGTVRVYGNCSPINTTDQISSCGSYTWIDGNTYTSLNNTATHTMTSSSGCDSIISLDLTVNNTTYATDQVTACDSYTWLDGNTYFASNNTAMYTLTNAAGCDSVVTLDLTINASSSSTDVISSCGSYTWIDGNTYTADNNTATYNLTNVAGCDSLVTLDLTIQQLDTSIVANATTLTSNATGVTYQWMDCNAGQIIQGETSASFNAAQNGSYAVIINDGTCTDTSECYTINTVGIDIEDTVEPMISVYPNPTYGKLNIRAENLSAKPTFLQVYGLTGQLIVSQTIIEGVNTVLLEVPAGLYLVKVNTNDKVFTHRIVKN